MATLYELNNAYARIQQMIEEGHEGLEDTLESITDAVEDKLEGYAMVKKNIESDIAGIKAEEKRLSERRKSLENSINRLDQAITDTLILVEGNRVKTSKFTFSFRKSTSVKVEDESIIPPQFIKVQKTVSRADIAKALKDGLQVDGASLVENQSLSIR